MSLGNLIHILHRQGQALRAIPLTVVGRPAAKTKTRKDVFPRRLRSEADIQEFLDIVASCEGDVYLKSPEGDIFNLKSSLSRYIAVGRLIEEEGDSLELFASRREDRARLMNLVADLNSGSIPAVS